MGGIHRVKTWLCTWWRCYEGHLRMKNCKALQWVSLIARRREFVLKQANNLPKSKARKIHGKHLSWNSYKQNGRTRASKTGKCRVLESCMHRTEFRGRQTELSRFEAPLVECKTGTSILIEIGYMSRERYVRDWEDQHMIYKAEKRGNPWQSVSDMETEAKINGIFFWRCRSTLNGRHIPHSLKATNTWRRVFFLVFSFTLFIFCLGSHCVFSWTPWLFCTEENPSAAWVTSKLNKRISGECRQAFQQ